MGPIGFEALKKVEERFETDVESYIAENDIKSKTGDGPMEDLGELTPKEFLDHYLTWNGLIGYTDDIIDLMEQLGWVSPQTQEVGISAMQFGQGSGEVKLPDAEQ